MSSRKGGEFEREIAKQLSLWWSTALCKKTRDDIFWRTAGSGARATVRTKSTQRTKGQYGDLCATDPIGRPFIDVFTTELKNGYSSHTISNLMSYPRTAKIQQYEKWLNGLNASHKAAGSLGWALIHKRPRQEPLILLPYSLWLDINVTELPLSLMIMYCPIRERKKRSKWQLSVVSLRFEDFLTAVDPERIVELSKS